MAAAVPKIDERQARKVAEDARETDWTRPSFGKQLFLGDLQLGLIHPHPTPTAEASREGEEYCARMLEFCETKVDSAQIERDAEIPGDVVKGLAELGAFGMKMLKARQSSPPFKSVASALEFAFMRRARRAMHLQYLQPPRGRGDVETYDFFRMACGPQTLAERHALAKPASDLRD